MITPYHAAQKAITKDQHALEIEKLRCLFAAMPEKVDGVLNQGFTHSVLMTFADEAGRQNYLPHPDHDALKQVFRPLFEDIVVFDYTI
ncbi:Dabb family protein [Vibrio navarrensis]|uniref:Dabb family protein n=1 Tax=Vibrio navarrensis TaxID=29495 RepID=UPI001869D3A9|nr:Dabb family protein [Vibrio navarrensis]